MSSSLPPIGAHVSIAGGVCRAIERGVKAGYDAIQIFVKSPNRWQGPRLGPEEAERFRDLRRDSPLRAVIAHAAYLINLAARDRTVLRRSRKALEDELDRCDQLGLDGLVLHPGAHMGLGAERGVERVGESLRRVLEKRQPDSCPVLLEITAGQGTTLGHRLEQLAAMRQASGLAERIGLCLDTCHAFAAGYPIHRPRGVDELIEALASGPGLQALRALHLNDSRHPFDSRRDRHANLGEGEIGAAAFRRIVRDPALARVPMVLETPRGDGGEGHRRDFRRLRRWRRS